LLLNNEGNIAESIHSNVFLLVNNRLITPDLKQGCTSGTMRKTIINVAKSMDIKVKEKTCSIKDLKRASEVFLTNSIKGIQWVKSYEGYSYDNSISKKLFKQLNEVIKQPIH
jgi:branched-chain amino acid aminotransferase